VKKQRKKGRRRGHGSRKGSKDARMDSRRLWIYRIRKIRRYLRYLRDKGVIDTRTYRMLYRRAKGGSFRTFEFLKHYLESEGIVKKAT
jgi:large subunit ribosomal protein L19e